MNKNNKYMTELQKSIEERTAEPCPNWMMPAVRTTAMQMEMLDRLQKALKREDNFLVTEIGSQGQTKSSANPLLATYRDAQRTLNQQLTSLGITYNATPRKITDTTKKGRDNKDPMNQWADTISGFDI